MLKLDLYEPTGDTAPLRPAVVWVHGGSFKSGSKTSAELVDQATVLGRKGWVGASISYRLSAQGCTVVNAACVAASVPLISGAMSQWEGQIALFDPARGGPCYECLFPETPDPELTPTCAQAGVIGALPGVIGSMMALEAIKLIARAGIPLRGALMIYDGLNAEARRMRIAPRAGCPVCHGAGGGQQGTGRASDDRAGSRSRNGRLRPSG